MSRATLRSLLTLIGTLAGAVASAGQEIVEFPLGYTAAGLTVGPDGNVWFTENGFQFISGHSGVPVAGPIAKITSDGTITQYPCSPWQGLADTSNGGIATASGDLWVISDGPGSASGNDHALTPCPSGVGIAVSIPTATGLIAGPEGNLWFALPFGETPEIGRSTVGGVVTTFPLPPGTIPASLAAGPDGNIWFSDSMNGRVGRMTTNGAVTLFDLPNTNAGPMGIAAGPDGNLWFVEYNANRIGRITTTGSITEFPIPTFSSRATQITPGADGAMWFNEGVGAIGRISTSGAISEIRVPYANANPYLIVGKPDGSIWFTDSRGALGGGDRIGRLSPSAGCAGDPQTLCLNLGAFSVTASFQRAPEADFTPASAVGLTGNTGYFWFFDPANVEMTVKVLDGCASNGHYWVFAGGMTNVGVDWKVTQLQTGVTKEYSNAIDTPFQPVQDTAAFQCP